MAFLKRFICCTPLLVSLGCASSPPPASPKPSPPADAAEPAMVGVSGAVPADKPEPADAAPSPAPSPASPPPAPAPVPYTLTVHDLTDPPAAPMLDAVSVEVRQGKWAKAAALLNKVLPGFNEKDPIYIRLAAHALAGRIAAQMKDIKKADAEYEAVLTLAKDPTAVSSAIDALGGNEADKRHRYQIAAFAVGEAQFFFADKKGREADDVPAPKYRGSGSRDDVLAFVNDKIMTWIKTKKPKIEEAEKEYAKIPAYMPAPHPRWVISGATRVGQMWSHFVDDFRNAPMPKEWLSNGVVPGTELTYAELRTEYRRKLEEASDPQLESARKAFKSCVDYATKFSIVNEESKSCEAWLASHPVAK